MEKTPSSRPHTKLFENADLDRASQKHDQNSTIQTLILEQLNSRVPHRASYLQNVQEVRHHFFP